MAEASRSQSVAASAASAAPTVVIGKRRSSGHDGGEFPFDEEGISTSPSRREPSRQRQRKTHRVCCDCTRHATCISMGDKGNNRPGCACRMAGRKCSSCACFARCRNKAALGSDSGANGTELTRFGFKRESEASMPRRPTIDEIEGATARGTSPAAGTSHRNGPAPEGTHGASTSGMGPREATRSRWPKAAARRERAREARAAAAAGNPTGRRPRQAADGEAPATVTTPGSRRAGEATEPRHRRATAAARGRATKQSAGRGGQRQEAGNSKPGGKGDDAPPSTRGDVKVGGGAGGRKKGAKAGGQPPDTGGGGVDAAPSTGGGAKAGAGAADR